MKKYIQKIWQWGQVKILVLTDTFPKESMHCKHCLNLDTWSNQTNQTKGLNIFWRILILLSLLYCNYYNQPRKPYSHDSGVNFVWRGYVWLHHENKASDIIMYKSIVSFRQLSYLRILLHDRYYTPRSAGGSAKEDIKELCRKTAFRGYTYTLDISA